MIEKEIIKDQKETIHRLQDECTEKTKIILKLHQENERLKQTSVDCLYNIRAENYKYYKALEEIREIAQHWLNNDWSCYHCRSNMDEKLKEIIKLTRC